MDYTYNYTSGSNLFLDQFQRIEWKSIGENPVSWSNSFHACSTDLGEMSCLPRIQRTSVACMMCVSGIMEMRWVFSKGRSEYARSMNNE